MRYVIASDRKGGVMWGITFPRHLVVPSRILERQSAEDLGHELLAVAARSIDDGLGEVVQRETHLEQQVRLQRVRVETHGLQIMD